MCVFTDGWSRATMRHCVNLGLTYSADTRPPGHNRRPFLPNLSSMVSNRIRTLRKRYSANERLVSGRPRQGVGGLSVWPRPLRLLLHIIPHVSRAHSELLDRLWVYGYIGLRMDLRLRGKFGYGAANCGVLFYEASMSGKDGPSIRIRLHAMRAW